MSSVADFMLPIRLRPEEQSASAGQTIFTLTTIEIPGADEDRVIININGKKQPKTSFTVNSSTQVTMSEALELNDLVEFIIPSYK